MNLRPLTVGSAVVLASCIAVGAASSGAFAAPEHHARQVASSAKKTSTAITDVQQAPQRVGALQWVEVRVTVDAPTVVRLLDPSGEAVDAKSGDPQKPIVFQVKPNGQDTARYAVDTGQSSTVRVVDLDFRELPLSAPLDLSSERRLEEIARAVAHGQFVHEMRYEALPGAEVTVVSNGRSEVVTASGDGVATVPVEFRAGDNQVRAKQVLGAKESLESDDHYTFGATDSGSGGGGGNGGGDEAGGGNGGGDKPGGGEQVDPASLRLDQQQGAELTPKDGKVTLSGRASSGWITVRDLEHGSDTTTEVHDGHWSVDVPATTPGWQIASIALSTTEHGAPVTQTTLRYVVRDSGDKPGGGGEQVDPASLRLDQQQGAELTPKDGKVTLSGRASSGWITVRDLEHGSDTTTEVHDGHWSVDVPATTPGWQIASIALSTTEHGAPVTQTTLRYVVRDSGDKPGGGGEAGDGNGGGEQPGDGNGETSPVELAVDQSGSLRLDSEGFVTYTGTAPGESVLVFVNGKRAGEYAVHDGHFAAKVYQAPGRYKLTILAKTNPHASVWDKVATTEVTVER
ncbi:hypothetical protein L2091_13585 [Curtobacterium albidum]|uniref:hypothetical protein n=1 Tax=Curtobacterium citreum TaxID=2036 RepID=UPI0020275F90|nr:hypothetical protein [Curtobacterium albidum]MCL9666258.1 hypothetical protein [Curtobacterium albidum]